MEARRWPQVIFAVLCCLILFSNPVLAEEKQITRSIIPQSPQPGELVTVTLLVPPLFYGSIIEQLPQGFVFEGTTHPVAGVKQAGQTIIFAITGEQEVIYTVRAPSTGSGSITGIWEDIGSKKTGQIPAMFLGTPGSNPESCPQTHHTPGFDFPVAVAAFGVVCILIAFREWTW